MIRKVMDVIHRNVGGLDVHKKMVMARSLMPDHPEGRRRLLLGGSAFTGWSWNVKTF